MLQPGIYVMSEGKLNGKRIPTECLIVPAAVENFVIYKLLLCPLDELTKLIDQPSDLDKLFFEAVMN
jgi:hypothetical protein